MTFALTGKTVADIRKLCKNALVRRKLPLRDLASLLGNLSWATAVVRYAQAHLRSLQSLYIEGLKSTEVNFQASVTITPNTESDLSWWINDAKFEEGKAIIMSATDISIYTDASLSGWGAVCQGIRTGGPWSRAESNYHINQLELLAALKGLECFTATNFGSTVELNIDNTTAVSYINKLGGSRSPLLCAVALRISAWCESRDMDLHAVFLPGVYNILADAESRRPLTAGDWKLDRLTFKQIQSTWRSEIDLFASEWN
ncbi:Uncharacterized protein APZ42_000435 [Daphnia magna]|uniref:RNase H type-1 domain-containing protein n=1 Tax=Daphnia magna TaxID=35525 RepID=A0A164JND5_9CRUS|nr:Uncharacterized protein APZ42_000435 [Daphnia magna]